MILLLRPAQCCTIFESDRIRIHYRTKMPNESLNLNLLLRPVSAWKQNEDTKHRRKSTGRERAASSRNSQDPRVCKEDETASFAIRAHVEIARRSLRLSCVACSLLRRGKKQEVKPRNKLIIDPRAPPCIHHTAIRVDMDHNRCRVSLSLFVAILIAVTARDRSHYRLSPERDI